MNRNHETHEISRKSKEWELGRRLCRSRFFRAVFVSFVVSWEEELTAEARRKREFRSFGGGPIEKTLRLCGFARGLLSLDGRWESMGGIFACPLTALH